MQLKNKQIFSNLFKGATSIGINTLNGLAKAGEEIINTVEQTVVDGVNVGGQAINDALTSTYETGKDAYSEARDGIKQLQNNGRKDRN